METVHLLIFLYSAVSFYLLICAMIKRDFSFPMVIGVLFWPLIIAVSMLLVIFAVAIYIITTFIVTTVYFVAGIYLMISSIFKRSENVNTPSN